MPFGIISPKHITSADPRQADICMDCYPGYDFVNGDIELSIPKIRPS